MLNKNQTIFVIKVLTGRRNQVASDLRWYVDDLNGRHKKSSIINLNDQTKTRKEISDLESKLTKLNEAIAALEIG